MRENYKIYYLKNGRLDLSLLEDPHKVIDIEKPKLYIDDNICTILEEMGNCFLEEEKI